jgi:hypothetical protein
MVLVQETQKETVAGLAEATTGEEVRAWAQGLAAMQERIGRHFARSEPRRRVVA